jgi:DNA-binding GntR family transcriptional regulator
MVQFGVDLAVLDVPGVALQNPLELAGQVIAASYLTGQYGVSRGTARRAVEVLRNEGLVRTIPQRGTYVSESTKN